MSAYTTIGRLFGYAALSIAGPLAALTVSNGFAAATPRAPLATDDQAPAVPFDPGALVNAIDDYASLLSILTGGNSAPPGLGGPAGAVPDPTSPYPLLPGV
ncbi:MULTISPECIES: hypothetical protein [unclassified Mycolicibacterium]|uniref:hypothetical protein n=1 Tax=unclassified Mycolicibacterium TaxID=2636767 RepID=UPI0012DEAFFF|nr:MULTISPECIES: hypothetical protein [unclassified Mycolicibacterium]MUL83714.1 hypothetical protein [Mycolicibacterium sp. CBMA 329]MUL90705.1 hypothetical protein [Mycolicibacterium sp. CBMA 331]MUM00674.1 hypothetical protein [Mycolicibacterium sp. CBMA 334]MUM28645.1 hypothetical protein [Mycolicibacterium sp. CBMA 295]MUM41649.1 hypothetical protein [Mycolicibacterium sp. CBMA 247]